MVSTKGIFTVLTNEKINGADDLFGGVLGIIKNDF